MAFMIVAGACGRDATSVADYVERVNTIVDQAARQYGLLIASPEGEVLLADPTELADFTPHDLEVALGRLREIEAEVKDAVDVITPPDRIADLHYLLFDFSRSIPIGEALAARAGAAADWYELSASPEMAAYRAQLAYDKQACADFEAEVNAAGERGGVFADVPWIPGEMNEIVDAVFGCAGFPENPEDAYRPPPSAAP